MKKFLFLKSQFQEKLLSVKCQDLGNKKNTDVQSVTDPVTVDPKPSSAIADPKPPSPKPPSPKLPSPRVESADEDSETVTFPIGTEEIIPVTDLKRVTRSQSKAQNDESSVELSARSDENESNESNLAEYDNYFKELFLKSSAKLKLKKYF